MGAQCKQTAVFRNVMKTDRKAIPFGLISGARDGLDPPEPLESPEESYVPASPRIL